jgi:site-specific DNA recombinase
MAKKKEVARVLPNVLGIYVRVSTDRQTKEGFSLEDQINSGIAKAKELGWSYTVYNDAGISGNVTWNERPELRRLISDMNEHKLGGIYTVAIDRLSRDEDYEEPQFLITIFKKSGLNVYTKTGEHDLKNEMVEVASRFMALFASMERNMIAKRTSNGVRNSMLKGNTAGGGPLVAYGFDKVDKKLVINENEAKTIRQMFQWCLEGKGTQTIANLLNEMRVPTKRQSTGNGANMTVKRAVKNAKNGEMEIKSIVLQAKNFIWRDATIYSHLTNTIYKGEKKWSDLVIQVPQIVSIETYDAVQVMLSERMKFKRAPYTNSGKQVNQFLLKGLIRCGECGQSFYGHKRSDLKDKAYRCLSHRYKNSWCGNRGIDINYVEELVWNNLLNFEKEVHRTFSEIESSEGVKFYKQAEERAQKIVTDNNKHIFNLTRNYNEGKIEEVAYKDLLATYKLEIEQQEAIIKDIQNDNFLIINKEKILHTVSAYMTEIRKASTFEEKQKYVRGFVDKIVVMSNLTQKGSHYQDVFIYYKLDQYTQFYCKSETSVEYKRCWHRIGANTKPLTILMYQEVKNSNASIDDSLHLTGF